MRLILTLALFISVSASALAQLKDEAILLVSFIGNESETDRRAVENHLEAELSRYFELKSEEEVLEALGVDLFPLEMPPLLSCFQDRLLAFHWIEHSEDFLLPLWVFPLILTG